MNYRELTEQDKVFLKGIFPPDRIEVEEINEDYSHDELGDIKSLPGALIFVKDTKEVSTVMRYANEHKIPVVVRGAGTGLVGGAVAVCGGIMLVMTQMDRILELDVENLTVTVEAGVLLATLSKFAEDNGFFYPPDPGEKFATLGGNISTNAGGMRAVKYGITREYVRELTVVMPNGDIEVLGGKVVKNSSGYSLKDLIIGSEGTLGIITQAVLKLIPCPKVSVSLLVPFEDISIGIGIVPKLIASDFNPTAVEFMERETILFAEKYLSKKFPDNSSAAYILLTFDGPTESFVEEQYLKAAEFCIEQGGLDVMIIDTESRKNEVWGTRSALLEAIRASTTEMDECDVVVPCSRVAEYIQFTKQVAAEENIRIPSFGHAGDGNLHVYICRDDLAESEWKSKLETVFDRLYNKAFEYGGLVSGEHGIGYVKKKYLLTQCGPGQIALMRGIKQAFDPNMILNPHKVI